MGYWRGKLYIEFFCPLTSEAALLMVYSAVRAVVVCLEVAQALAPLDTSPGYPWLWM